MFGSGFLLLIIVCAAIWFWFDSSRARELATAIGTELCRRRQLQFLDDTASLSSLSLCRTEHGLRLQRIFYFEYSDGGMGRRYGSVTVTGNRISCFELENSSWDDTETPQEPPRDENRYSNIIPFERDKSR